MELVHQPFIRVARVLRNLFDECFVVQPMDRLEFRRLGGDLDFQR